MKEIAKCSSENELSDFIISYFKEKVMRLKIYKELEDDDDTGTKFAGKCYEGCPPSYQSKIDEIEDNFLVVIRNIFDERNIFPILMQMDDEELALFLEGINQAQLNLLSSGIDSMERELLVQRLEQILENNKNKKNIVEKTIDVSKKSLEMKKKEISNNNKIKKASTLIEYKNYDDNLEKIIFENPTANDLIEYMSLLPENSIVEMSFVGHGSSILMEINSNTGELLMGVNDISMTGEGNKSFLPTVKSKLSDNAHIRLEGCNTAQWTNNISKRLSEKLPGIKVTGSRGYIFNTYLIGGRTTFAGLSRTYVDGKTSKLKGEETYEKFMEDKYKVTKDAFLDKLSEFYSRIID